MKKFVVSTDSCADMFAGEMRDRGVECIALSRVTNGVQSAEIYDSTEEYEAFYESIRKGALPKTSQLTPYELVEYFGRLGQKHPDADIIHLSLSSGLSNTFQSCTLAASEYNQGRTVGRVYPIDSLSATLGMQMMVDCLLELRDSGATVEQAIERTLQMRAHQQIWAVIGDLPFMRRGGRLSSFKAALGGLLNLKPVIVVNTKGKLTVETTQRGTKKAMQYILGKMKQYGTDAGVDFCGKTVYIIHSCCLPIAEELGQSVLAAFDGAKIKIGFIGPIVGSHTGVGTFGIMFEGAPRLTI